jgi:hypothetical protein
LPFHSLLSEKRIMSIITNICSFSYADFNSFLIAFSCIYKTTYVIGKSTIYMYLFSNFLFARSRFYSKKMFCIIVNYFNITSLLVTDIFTAKLIGFVRTIDAYLTYPAERLSNHVLSMKLGDTIQGFRYRTYFNL